MQISTLHLSYITCIDHAFISQAGTIVGGSYHPTFEVTGEVEANESVVVDFSRVKKEIKSRIDDKENGYDHKLWILPGYSKAVVRNIDQYNCTVETPYIKLTLPKNAVKVFGDVFSDYISFEKWVDAEIAKAVQGHLNVEHPDLNITVQASMTECAFTTRRDPQMWRYSHGLKNSSSWGCQNHSHGHLSFIEYEYDTSIAVTDQVREARLILCGVVDSISNSVFINAENIKGVDGPWLSIGYETARGRFEAKYNRDFVKVVVLPTETTIEFIADWFVEANRHKLKEAAVTRVMLSEGLAKGAVVAV